MSDRADHRRRTVLVVAAAALVACGSGPRPGAAPPSAPRTSTTEAGTQTGPGATAPPAGGPSSTATGGPARTAPAGRGTTVAAAGSPPPTSTRPGSTAPAATAATGRTAPSPTAAPTTAAGDPVVAAAKGGVGSAAGVLLSPRPATTVVVEVLSQDGATVDQAALDLVTKDLRTYTGKTVVEAPRVALGPGDPDHDWTTSELAALADGATRQRQGGTQVVLHYLYVRGKLSDRGILGVAFRGDLLATFPDQTASLGTTPQAVQAILVHETGHLLGLVDLWLNRNRSDTTSDPARHGHSQDKRSVMYWQVNTDVTGLVLASPSTTFDADDERDLAAIRGGAPPGSNPP